MPAVLDAARAKGYLNFRETINREIPEECIVDITISGRHLEITPAIRQYAEEKVSKLPKYYDLIQIVEVILDGHEAKRTRAEIVVIAEHKNRFVAHHEGEDLYGCIDQAMHKVQQQLTAHKERFRNRKHNAG
jgi:putative sigma-54 modulation protein